MWQQLKVISANIREIQNIGCHQICCVPSPTKHVRETMMSAKLTKNSKRPSIQTQYFVVCVFWATLETRHEMV